MLSFAFDVDLWKNQNQRLLLMRRRLYQDNRGAMKTVKVTQLVRPYWKYLIVAFVAMNQSLSRSLKELPEEGQQRGLGWENVPRPEIRRHG